MTLPRWIPLTTALSTCLVVAGCTQQSSGSPLPYGNIAASGETSSTERPREINLTGQDPCGLIPQTDWPTFGIARPGDPYEEPNLKSPSCYYSGVGEVTLVVTKGIETWDEAAEVSAAKSIERFPTITIWNEIDKRSCYTAVDVMNGQHLLTTALSTEANVNRTATCDLSHQLAESAMKTLLAS